MKLLREKSGCCNAKIIRFGGKRRQCVACDKTWRVHPAKRGRKAKRKQKNYLDKVFSHGFSVKQLAMHSNLSVDAIYKRFGNNLTSVVKSKRIIRIEGKKLILIIDAEWQYFNGELWTLYFMAVKSVGSKFVVVLDPILKPGKESAINWNSVINELPPTIKNRIIAVVSDGIRGIETVTNNHDWIIQRCHFHLLSTLQKMRGKRVTTSGRLIREEIYQLVKLALIETSKRRLNVICKRLAFLAKEVGCPKRMRMIVRDFLRRLTEFRSYLEYPDFHLPTTTNVMESVNSIVRRKTKTINSSKAWHKWATATIRLKSKFNCK